MKYFIKIQVGEHKEGDLEKYIRWDDVYEQIVDDLDLTSVVAVVNKLKKEE